VANSGPAEAPQDRRITRRAGSIWDCAGSFLISRSSVSTNTSPASRVFCAIVVSGGLATLAAEISSKPITDTSFGTAICCS